MEKVLELKNVSKIYSETKNITNFLSKSDDQFVAVDNVSFSLESKKVLGLVGESGSGKSTCALMAMKLLEITEGEIFVNSNNITNLSLQELKQYRKEMQIVFQDSYSSLDPMMTISKNNYKEFEQLIKDENLDIFEIGKIEINKSTRCTIS